MSKSSEIAIVLLGLFSMVLSMPAALQKRNSDNDIQLLKYHDDRNADGSYEYNYELSDGQSRQEKGSFTDGKDANGSEIKVLSVTGSYSFVSPDGKSYQVFYTADERGFRIERMSAVESITSSTGIKKDDEEEIAAVTTAVEAAEALTVTTESTIAR